MQGSLLRPGILPSALGVLLGALACQPASALPTGSAGTHWPAPVARFIERSEGCLHFAGEFNGDGSARDAEVGHRMNELRCNSLLVELQALRKQYRSDVQVIARLGAFDEDGLPRHAEAGR